MLYFGKKILYIIKLVIFKDEKRLRQIEFEKRLQEEQHFQAKIAQKQLLDKEKNAKLLQQVCIV